MNEITRIHLGRQPFTIAVDAHRELRAYLTAIQKEVDSKDVLEEIELRMAELLSERNIDSRRVILTNDVDFLKKQLGEASDFSESEPSDETRPADEDGAQKRLFRDPDQGMVAGVAAGLAKYLGIDPIIIRLIFVVLTFTGGAGILAYVLLWLLVPPVRTGSDRLQMNGKAVTIDNIKESIERADVPGAATRVGHTVGKILSVVTRICANIIGVMLIVFGTALLLADATALCFGLIHGLTVAGNIVIFPVGVRETVALVSAFMVILVLSVLFMLAGRAVIRQKWGVPSWALAAFVGLFIASASIGTATSATLVQPVRQRIQSIEHNDWHSTPSFTDVSIGSGLNNVGWYTVYDTHYGVTIQSIGKTNAKSISVKVTNGKLYIDGNVSDSGCTLICPYGDANVMIQVHMPPAAAANMTQNNLPAVLGD